MKVIYSKRHYNWLISAGLWPMERGQITVAEPRMAISGEVVGTRHGMVEVNWGENRLYRHKENGRQVFNEEHISWHFMDNVEFIEFLQ